jgi:hypothetical protein
MSIVAAGSGPCDPSSPPHRILDVPWRLRTPGAPASRRRDVLRIIPSQTYDVLRRARVERFIETAYRRQFDSAITAHYPTLISLHASDETICAALGVRRAADDRLFLENYFEEPIEHMVSAATGKVVDRQAIVEIGNLASVGRRSTLRLIAAAAVHMRSFRGHFVVATATEQLRHALTAFGFAWVALAPARAERLLDAGRSWGRYYAHDPQIIVGVLHQTLGRFRCDVLRVDASQ